jgi:hypothetical protein
MVSRPKKEGIVFQKQTTIKKIETKWVQKSGFPFANILCVVIVSSVNRKNYCRRINHWGV